MVHLVLYRKLQCCEKKTNWKSMIFCPIKILKKVEKVQKTLIRLFYLAFPSHLCPLPQASILPPKLQSKICCLPGILVCLSIISVLCNWFRIIKNCRKSIFQFGVFSLFQPRFSRNTWLNVPTWVWLNDWEMLNFHPFVKSWWARTARNSF